MMLFKTLRVRLTLLYSFGISVLFLAFVVVLFYGYKKVQMKTIEAHLMNTGKTYSMNDISPKLLDANSEIIRRLGNEYYRFINHNGEVIISSMNLRQAQQWPLDTSKVLAAFRGTPKYDTVKYKGENFRMLYFPVNEENIVHIGASLDDMEKSIAHFKMVFASFFPFFVTITAFSSWFLAGKMVAPLVTVKALAEDVKRGKIQERLAAGSTGKEIGDLTSIFNDMLDMMHRSMETQKRFTSDVSHEIRSPLTSLRGSIEVALRKKRAPEEYEDLLRNNLADIVRISRISDNLLFLSRADNNILEMRRQWVDVSDLLQRVVDQLSFKARTSGISIRSAYIENLEVSGDPELLEQAFINILDNAIKYSCPEGQIEIRPGDEADVIFVRISDTGIGIPEKDLAHIFDRFYRVDKAHSRKLGGTGLGLAITQWIVNAHGGKIEVKSVEGSGTEFTVSLPKSQHISSQL